MEVESPSYPTIVRWRDREVPLSWYEFVFQPEKLKEHLEILADDSEKEPTFYQIISSFLDKSGAVEGQAQETNSLSAPNDQVTNTSSDASTQKSSGLLYFALFVASFMRWDIEKLESGLPPLMVYSLLKALKKIKGNEDIPSSCVYYHWLVRFCCRFDLPVKRGKMSIDHQMAIPNEKLMKLLSDELPTAKEFLRAVCDKEDDVPIPVVLLPKNMVQISLDGMCERANINIGQIWHDLAQIYFKDEEFQDALTAFNNCLLYLQKSPHLVVLYSEDDIQGFISACQSVLETESSFSSIPTLSEAKAFLEERKYDELVSVLLNDVVKGEIPEWFREELLSSIKPSPSKLETADEEVPLSKKQKVEAEDDKIELDKEIEGTVWYEILTCETLYNLVQGNPHCCHWQQLLRKASKKEIEVVAELLIRWKRMLESYEYIPADFQLQTIYCYIRLVAIHLAHFNNSMSLKLMEIFDLQDLDVEDPVGAPLLFENPPLLKEPIEVLLKQGTPVYAESAEGRAMNIISVEKELLIAKSPKEVVQLVGRLYELLPLDQMDSYATKFDSTVPGFVSVSLMSDPVLRTKYNIVIAKAHKFQAVHPSQLDYRKCLEFYRAAVRLLEGQPPGVKASRIPYLQEKILTMELGHASSTWADTSMNKFPVLIEKAKVFLRQSQSAGDFSPSVIQAACAFLLNAKEYSFLASLDHLYKPGKVAPRLAAVLNAKQEGSHMRKPIRDLFEAVLSVFAVSDGLTPSEVREIRSSFEVFVDKLRNEECILFLLSALGRLWNMIKPSSFEISLQHSNHWPTALGSQNVNADLVYRSLILTLEHTVKQYPMSGQWIVMHGDIQFVCGAYGAALKLYLEAGSVTSDHFTKLVPDTVWTPAVYRNMMNCCSELQLPVHALILCQYTDPINYKLAFSLIKSSANDNVDLLSECVWDMTLIEFLIYTYNKEGDTFRRSHMVRLAGQPQLNVNNSSDILLRAQDVRRKRFFTELFRLTHTV